MQLKLFKVKEEIKEVLILTGTESDRNASSFFKKYFFAKIKNLGALLEAGKDLNQARVTDAAQVIQINEAVEKRIAAFREKASAYSAGLRDEEWKIIQGHSGMNEKEFAEYKNRSSGVFETTRVYLAFKEPDVA